jgi:hypothetical protein
MTTWADLTNSPATLGWSVINVMRAKGVSTKTAIFNAWLAAEHDPTGTLTDLTINLVQTGIDFLTANGFCDLRRHDGRRNSPRQRRQRQTSASSARARQ